MPILRAKLQMRKDLTAAGYQQPSYSDAFFTTLVHEFGHALGLQHTFTSAVMSTAITRATTRGLPLAADDVAGISLLYPAGGYAAATGSIAGQVTVGGVGRNVSGINLASVVALSTSGVAISGMTHPDGTYRIDGVPPGQYYVYVHPLPPAQTGEGTPANIMPPVDAQNDDFSANTKFATQFFPGTQDWTQATVIGVAAGKAVTKIDFAVTANSGPAVSGMQTYGYPNGVAIAAPPLVTKTRDALVFYANGATVNNQSAMAPGLNVSVIGDAASIEAGSLKYYQQGFPARRREYRRRFRGHTGGSGGDAEWRSVCPAGGVHGGPQPRAFHLRGDFAGSIRASGGDHGQRDQSDGEHAHPVRGVAREGAVGQSDGSLAIAEPPGLSGSQATVEAVNPDGQSSLQSIGTAARPLFTYPQSDAARIFPWPYIVTAGTDTLMVVSGVNTHFAEGETVIGFGSSDISVRGSWVVSPQMVMLNLSVDPAAQPGTTYVTASTGLETLTLGDLLNIAVPDPHQISLRVPILNAVTGLAGVPAGGTALIATSGLPANLDGWTLAVGPKTATFTADKNGVLTVNVPLELGVGTQPVQLTAPGNPPTAVIPR